MGCPIFLYKKKDPYNKIRAIQKRAITSIIITDAMALHII
jgi:hypothetical protein